MNTYIDFLEGLPGKGPVPADRMLVGMAPSTNRPYHRRLEPFGASSWRILNKIQQGVSSSLYVTNLVKDPVKPGKRLYKKDIRRWAQALATEIKSVSPKRIMAMGTQVAQELCPNFTNLRQDRGTFFWNPDFEVWIVPTYHFSAAARDRSRWKYLIRDLERFFELPDPVPAKYNLVEDPFQIPLERRTQVFLDLEGTGVNVGSEITMVGVGTNGKTFIINQPDRDTLVKLGSHFKKNKVTMVAHNAPYDLMMLLYATKWKWPRLRTEDTLLMAHTAGEESLSLKHLTTFHTDLPGSHSGGGFEDPLYLAEDVRSTEAIYQIFSGVNTRFITSLLNSVVPIVASMRLRGVHIDKTRLKEVGDELQHEYEEIEKQLNHMTDAEVNWGSPQQVAQFFVDQGAKLTEKTPTGQYSVAESALLDLAALHQNHEPHITRAVELILEYRALGKTISTYVDNYNKWLEFDGKLHPRLLLQGTVTGRLACRDPNTQNVPRSGPIKTVYVSRWKNGLYFLVDLSQAELRVAALLSNDEKMADALLSGDVHRSMASLAFGLPADDINAIQRKASKAVTFGLLYGGSINGIAGRAGLPTRQVKQVMGVYENEFPDLMNYLEKTRKLGINTQQSVSLFGRTRDLSSIIANEGEWGAERKAINTPIQSLASDLNLVILNTLDSKLRERHLKSRPLFLVHDSIVGEMYPGEDDSLAECVRAGFRALWFTPLAERPLFEKLPIIGELILGPNWAAVESTNENYDPVKVYPCSSHHLLEVE